MGPAPVPLVGRARWIAVFGTVLVVATTASAEPGPSRYGVKADLGLPDGLMASFVYRVRPQVTTHAGLGHNLNGAGLRLGSQLDFRSGTAAPYLAVDLGHYFRSSTPSWMQKTAKNAGLDDKTLERLGYSFANAHLGLRVGSSRAGFYLQAGLSYVRAGTNIIKPKPNITPAVDLYRETIVNLLIIGGHTGMYWYF